MANNKKLFSAASGIALCLGGAWWWHAQARGTDPQGDSAGDAKDSSAQVSTAELRKGPVDVTVSGYGTVTAAPGRSRSLTLAQAGLVGEVRTSAGEVVKRGATLLTLSTDPAGRLAYEQARTGLDFARSELERTRQLRSQNLATESQLAAAMKALDDAQATLAAQVQLGTAAAQTELKAPFDGVVIDVAVAVGDHTAAGAVLAHLAPVDAVQVLVGLAPADARRVRSGMSATLVAPSAGDAPIAAKVTHVPGMLNPQTHLVDVSVQPVGAGGGLFQSEIAHATITLETRQALLVPRDAVLSEEGSSYLFQVANGHAKKVEVSTTAETDQLVAVEGAVDPAGKVVVLGAHELEDGMAVREAAAPAADKDDGKAGEQAPAGTKSGEQS